MIRYVLGLAALATTTGAIAINGNQALELMTGSERKDLLLSTYVLGVFDQEIVVQVNAKAAILKNAPIPIWPFCPPKGVSASQGAAVIRATLQNEPANNHEDLILITRRSFSKAWECSRTQLLE